MLDFTQIDYILISGGGGGGHQADFGKPSVPGALLCGLARGQQYSCSQSGNFAGKRSSGGREVESRVEIRLQI